MINPLPNNIKPSYLYYTSLIKCGNITFSSAVNSCHWKRIQEVMDWKYIFYSYYYHRKQISLSQVGRCSINFPFPEEEKVPGF